MGVGRRRLEGCGGVCDARRRRVGRIVAMVLGYRGIEE